jgi:hypothetical protein
MIGDDCDYAICLTYHVPDVFYLLVFLIILAEDLCAVYSQHTL